MKKEGEEWGSGKENRGRMRTCGRSEGVGAAPQDSGGAAEQGAPTGVGGGKGVGAGAEGQAGQLDPDRDGEQGCDPVRFSLTEGDGKQTRSGAACVRARQREGKTAARGDIRREMLGG